jgi:hypothetical protein
MTFTMGGFRRTNTWVRIAPTILAKPLAGADFGKPFNPEDFALIKLDCSEIKDHQRRKARSFVAN